MPPASPVDAAPTEADGPPTAVALPDGLPAGVVELAARRWRRADALAERTTLQPATLDDAALDRRLVAELTAPLRLEDWPAPTEPRPLATGWIHDEVVDDDRDGFEAFLAAWPDAGANQVASRCQELRWPVTPYVALDGPVAARDADRSKPEATAPGRPARPGPRSDRPLVIDLTSHWAGPLATGLLAEAGAEIIKVEPSCRPDGFRSRRALHDHLNASKTIIDLDLRLTVDRDRFERLVAQADLLVESFSRRVLPNLGYDGAALTRINPTIGMVSIKAFPAGTDRSDWLAYGPGVHAASGLGLVTGRPRPAPIAYPDLVAGVTGYAEALALLTAGGGSTEVSLAGSIAPLVERARADG